jgi:hypothetical protein
MMIGGSRDPITPGGGGGSDPGGGGGRTFIQGGARDLALLVSSDQTQITITLTPNDNNSYSSAVFYRIFWLNPAIFSRDDIYGSINAPGVGLISGRQFVVDMSGGQGIISTVVPYPPYQKGGWMYAVVIPTNDMKEYRLGGTNFVAVPTFGAAGIPQFSVQGPIVVTRTSTPDGLNRIMQAYWKNPRDLTTVDSVNVWIQNYWKDGSSRQIVTYKLTTGPGADQGSIGSIGGFSFPPYTTQTFVLEPDSSMGAHTVTFVFQSVTPAGIPLDLGSSPSYAFPGPNGIS